MRARYTSRSSVAAPWSQAVRVRSRVGRSVKARIAGMVGVVVAMVLGLALPAGATWSIAATDPATGDAGVALASCVPADLLGPPDQPLAPVVILPGRAAAVTQGELNTQAPAEIRDLLAADTAPADVIQALTGATFDPAAATRQHAVVSRDGRAAAYTGPSLTGRALDRQAPGVSAQGNLLRSDAVVTDAIDAFDRSRVGGADLATALVRGLQAGAAQGGDRRCPGQTALFAQVVVAQATDPADAPSTVLTVTVDPGDGQNPVDLLASGLANGQRGLVAAGRGTPKGSGGRVQLAALAAGLVMVVAALGVLRVGLGSRTARRRR